jgi:hypothetical protein
LRNDGWLRDRKLRLTERIVKRRRESGYVEFLRALRELYKKDNKG